MSSILSLHIRVSVVIPEACVTVVNPEARVVIVVIQELVRSTLSFFFTSFLFSSSFSCYCTSVPATKFRLFKMLCVNTTVKRILDLSQFFREFPVEC